MQNHEMDARWLRLWTSLGSSHAQALIDWRDLVARYSVPERAYHSIEHILDCQREFDGCRGNAMRVRQHSESAERRDE